MNTSNELVKAQLRALALSAEDTETRMRDLQAQLVCECCDGKEGVSVRPIMCKQPICLHCFYVWYEYGLTDPVKVRDASIERQQSGKPGERG